jgi:hypothetical protein
VGGDDGQDLLVITPPLAFLKHENYGNTNTNVLERPEYGREIESDGGH